MFTPDDGAAESAGIAVNKELAARKLRERLEQRLARFLACEPSELPHLKLGTLVHTMFLLFGDGEQVGGFHSTMNAVLQLCGYEIVWEVDEVEKKEPTPPPVVN